MEVQIHLLIGGVLLLFLAVFLAIAQHREGLPAPTGLISSKKKFFRRDRRVFPRYNALLRIKYKTPLEEGISWIKDISRGGARLFLNNLAVGTVLSLEINLPYDQNSIFAQGNIVWRRGTDSGLNFGAAEQDDLTRIIEYIGLQKKIRSSKI